MEENPPELFVDYETILQKALRSAVREILKNVETQGLLGDHHYYISFLTNHPKTQISHGLKAEYPEEITIVLQNQFWDLQVDPDGFSVRLGFGARFENIYVPFTAMLGFSDPAAEFVLPFKASTEEEPAPEPAVKPAPEPVPAPKGEVAAFKAPKVKKAVPKDAGTAKDNVVTLDKFRTTKD